MNKYLVTVQVLCEKTVFIKANTPAEAEEIANQGKGLQIGQTLKVVKQLDVQNVQPTEMEIKYD